MPTTDELYALWTNEIIARDEGFVPTRDAPGKFSRDVDGPIDGYWRVMGARTKHDMPIGIWRRGEGDDHVVLQYGAEQPATIPENGDRFMKFRSTWFNSCAAVRKAEWDQALTTGFWPDGKPAREMSGEEKQGIDTSTGGNNPPIEESLADQIAAQVEKAKSMPEPTTQAEADAATGVVEKLRKLWKRADEARVVEKRPHDEAAAAVQTKWLTIMDPAKDEGAALDKRRKEYLRKEQARLDAIAAEETRKRQEEARRAAQAERERLQKIADDEAAAERERRHVAAEKAAEEARQAQEAAAADASKQADADRMAAEAKAAEDAAAQEVVAEEVAEPEIVVASVEAERATAGTAFGRNSGLKKVKRGKIIDMAAFLTANAGNDDIKDLAQKIANRLAKAGVATDGMKIEEVLE